MVMLRLFANTVMAFLADMCRIDLGAPEYITPSENYMMDIRHIANKERKGPWMRIFLEWN